MQRDPTETTRAMLGCARAHAAGFRTRSVLRGFGCAALALALGASSGCLYTRYATNTSRSATEQLLISQSIRKVTAALQLPDLRDRKVAVRISAIPTQDLEYLKAALAGRLAESGARIVEEEQADLVVVALTGAIGTVARQASFGIPSLPVPSVGATPELPFVAVSRQRAWTQAQLFTWDKNGVLVERSDPVMETSRFDVFNVFFFGIRSNDIYPNENGTIAVE